MLIRYMLNALAVNLHCSSNFSYLMKVWVEPVDTLLQGFETHKSGTTSTNTSATSTPTGLAGTPSVHKHKKRDSEVRLRNEGGIAHELV